LTEKSNGKIDKSEAIEITIFSDELTKEVAKCILLFNLGLISQDTLFKREITNKKSTEEEKLRNLEDILDKF